MHVIIIIAIYDTKTTSDQAFVRKILGNRTANWNFHIIPILCYCAYFIRCPRSLTLIITSLCFIELEPNKLLVSINSSISKLIRAHQYSQALDAFYHLGSSLHLNPDQYSLTSALVACTRLRAKRAGAQLHAHASRSGLHPSSTHVANSLLSFYSKCHGPDLAHSLFDSMPSPDAYSYTTLVSSYAKNGRVSQAFQLFDKMPERITPIWNAMITGCIDNGYRDVALELFLRMHSVGVWMDHYSFVSVISLCDSPVFVSLARQLHLMVLKTGNIVFRVSVLNAIVKMYFDCGLIGDACAAFGEAVLRDEISYNTFIAGLVRWGRHEEALMSFKQMREEAYFKPTELTLVSVVSACLTLKGGQQVHAEAFKTAFDASLLVSNSLVTLYSDCGDIHSAQQVFDGVGDKDTVSWNSMIGGYSQCDRYESMIAAFRQMLCGGIEPDDFTFGSVLACTRIVKHAMMIHALVIGTGFISSAEVCNSMITAYSRCGEIDSAHQVFKQILFPNLISWNSIIAAFVLNELPVRAFGSFSALLVSGFEPNSYTLSTMLSTCAGISALRHGKEVHGCILKSGFCRETSLENALITMYAKCGDLKCSSEVFNGMSHKDVVSWNAMIAGYAQNGEGHQAIQYFKAMRNSETMPDQVTFTAVLSACSHAGLVDEGRWIFTSMVEDYGIEPGADHYSCMIDLLGRGGHLDDAESIINSMPCGVNSHVWWALLSACSTHGNVRLGKIAAKFILATDPDNAAVYVLLSNLVAAEGKWEEASSFREDMRRNGKVKEPACCWI